MQHGEETARRPSRRRRAFVYGAAAVAALAGLAAVLSLVLRDTDEIPERFTPTASNHPVRDLRVLSDAQASKLRNLRDEALECMGWSAGNSFRGPSWPEVESYVGQRGLYYDAFLELTPPGMAADLASAERDGNLERYRAAFNRGRGAPPDEDEVERCIERTIEISRQIRRMLDDIADAPSLDSPLSLN